MREELTIQQKIFGEIKRRDRISALEIGRRVGIKKTAIAHRMVSDIGLANFVQMLKACGYDMNITKAPEGREPGVFFGLAGCDGCPYKNTILEFADVAEQLKANDQGEAVKLDTADTPQKNTEENA